MDGSGSYSPSTTVTTAGSSGHVLKIQDLESLPDDDDVVVETTPSGGQQQQQLRFDGDKILMFMDELNRSVKNRRHVAM